jgi:organic radical activating enzyme
MEHFYTIQGEGVHSGTAAYFIRLAGCNVGCVWCDVKDSWSQEYPIMSANELLEQVRLAGASKVVVTGGEPLIHNLNPLCTALHKAGVKLHLETSGAHPISGTWDWICLSPKKFKMPLPGSFQLANELKVVVYNAKDLDWAIDLSQYVVSECRLLLQPEWGRIQRVTPWIIDFVKARPTWVISLQTHKYMNIP